VYRLTFGTEQFSLTFTVKNLLGWMSLHPPSVTAEEMFFIAVFSWWKQE
jgi:hypothetical protein